jgi:hypothetical protein
MLLCSLYLAITPSAKFKEGQTFDGLTTREHCHVTYWCSERLTRYEHILGSGGMAPQVLNLGSYEGVYLASRRGRFISVAITQNAGLLCNQSALLP